MKKQLPSFHSEEDTAEAVSKFFGNFFCEQISVAGGSAVLSFSADSPPCFQTNFKNQNKSEHTQSISCPSEIRTDGPSKALQPKQSVGLLKIGHLFGPASNGS